MGIVTDKTDHFQDCINACMKCAQACFECFDACLNEPDVKERKNCIGMLIRCAIVCQMTIAEMSMSGSFAKEQCKLCADICYKCSEECNLFKDAHCIECAEVCRDCGEECIKMTYQNKEEENIIQSGSTVSKE
jgi:hypothetical protein